MTLRNFRESCFEALSPDYPEGEARSLFSICTQTYLNMSRLEVALHPDKELDTTQYQELCRVLGRLKRHEPIQYITGEAEFFGLSFAVDEHVLIPRPETEELVSWVLEETSGRSQPKILDIGTGSGCIAISLAKNLPNAEIWALDRSEDALRIAKRNAARNAVEISFIHRDILLSDDLGMKYDVIVSNPPYVRELEKKEMHPNVLDFEPPEALYVPESDPLVFYRKITDLAGRALCPDGLLFFEINQYLSRETSALLNAKNFRTCLRKDIFGADRLLKAVLK